MKNNKKIVAIFGAALLMVTMLLGGCKSEGTGGKDNGGAAASNKTVEITLTKEMLTMGGGEANYTLTQEQKDKGFISVTKNDDGSATYTIKEKDYKVFIADLRAEATKGIDSIVTEGTFKSIKSITYNDDLSEITITADKAAFGKGLDAMSMMSCSLNSLIYQRFDVDAEGKCTVYVKDASTGEVFKTEEYPKA